MSMAPPQGFPQHQLAALSGMTPTMSNATLMPQSAAAANHNAASPMPNGFTHTSIPGLATPSLGALGSGVSSNSAMAAATMGNLFPAGAAVLRLLSMYDAMSDTNPNAEGKSLDLGYWKAFVQEFFMPDGCYRQVVWNPQTREQRAFEMPVCVLARYLHTARLSGTTSRRFAISGVKEYPPGTHRDIPPPPPTKRSVSGLPNARTTHFIEIQNAQMTVTYENGWAVVQSGLLRAGLTPFASNLRFQFIDFHVSSLENMIPRSKILRSVTEQPLSEELVSKIRGSSATDSKDFNSNGSNERKSQFKTPVEKLTLPESPVNEYGLTLRAMRCLEICESVCQLRDLMDYAGRHSLGPLDALRGLAEEFRNAQRESRAAGTVNEKSGEVAPSPAGTDSAGSQLKRKNTGSSTASGVQTKMEDDGAVESPKKRIR